MSLPNHQRGSPFRQIGYQQHRRITIGQNPLLVMSLPNHQRGSPFRLDNLKDYKNIEAIESKSPTRDEPAESSAGKPFQTLISSL